MAISQGRSLRTPTGARLRAYRKKRTYELGSPPTLPKLAPRQLKSVRRYGGVHAQRLLQTDSVNVYDPKTKQCFRAVIKNVVENPANRYYVRRNVMTKGTLVVTDKGKVKITSRPGQETSMNGVLVG